MVLDYLSVDDGSELLAVPVARFLDAYPNVAGRLQVAEIDPSVADTAECCERYGISMEDSANCVVIAGKRGDVVKFAACIVLATTRADVNGIVRKRLDARKASFAPVDEAVERSGMEFGGITPFGLPDDWPVFVDSRVIEREFNCYGSGLRKSKLFGPGKCLLDLPNVEVVEGLAAPVL